jgi:hypothetical protein
MFEIDSIVLTTRPKDHFPSDLKSDIQGSPAFTKMSVTISIL